MELHQIRYFLALSDALNFTRAAERCSVAQSSLTRAIKALEQELGGALFHRERANTHLSRLGQKVKPFLEQAYAHVEDAKRHAEEFIRQQGATLRLGLMSSIAPERLTPLVAAMRARHQNVALSVAEAPAQALQQRLLAGELDAAIYALPGLAEDDRFDHLPLYREPFVIAVKAGHRLARLDGVRAQDLAGEPHLARVACEFSDLFAARLAEHGIEHPIAHRGERDDWILAMAAAGLGYGLVPAFSTAYPGIVALPLSEPLIAREIALVRLHGRPDTVGLGALVREAALLHVAPAAGVNTATFASSAAR